MPQPSSESLSPSCSSILAVSACWPMQAMWRAAWREERTDLKKQTKSKHQTTDTLKSIKLNANYLVNKHDVFKCVSLKDCSVLLFVLQTYHFCPFCHEHEDLLQAPAALLSWKCDPPESTQKDKISFIYVSIPSNISFKSGATSPVLFYPLLLELNPSWTSVQRVWGSYLCSIMQSCKLNAVHSLVHVNV